MHSLGDNSITGVNSTQNSEMTKPPRPVQPAPNGHEIPVLEEPELPTSTSADVMEPAGPDEGTRRSKWDWIQGVFSIGKKEEGASVDEAADAVIANEARQSEKSGKENIAEVQGPVAGVVSREPPSVAASAELQKEKTDAEVPGLASQVNEARETVSGVVDKMPRAVSGKWFSKNGLIMLPPYRCKTGDLSACCLGAAAAAVWVLATGCH